MIIQFEYHHGFYDLIFAVYLAKNNEINGDFFLQIRSESVFY